MGAMEFNEKDMGIIRTIQESVATDAITVDGVQFVTRKIYEPPEPSTVDPLEIHTLAGVVDYLKADSKLDQVIPQSSDAEKILVEGERPRVGLAVHVQSESEVQIIGAVFGRFRQREVFLQSSCHQVLGTQFSFGNFYPLEVFNIFMRSFFVANDDIENLLRLTGNISQEDQEQWTDDGVSQSVLAKTGISKREDVVVPPFYTLQPFRTFRDPEIEQPKSDFFLRLRKGNPPQAALFETDGGAWKLRAIEQIRRYLTEGLEGLDIPIIA